MFFFSSFPLKLPLPLLPPLPLFPLKLSRLFVSLSISLPPFLHPPLKPFAAALGAKSFAPTFPAAVFAFAFAFAKAGGLLVLAASFASALLGIMALAFAVSARLGARFARKPWRGWA